MAAGRDCGSGRGTASSAGLRCGGLGSTRSDRSIPAGPAFAGHARRRRVSNGPGGRAGEGCGSHGEERRGRRIDERSNRSNIREQGVEGPCGRSRLPAFPRCVCWSPPGCRPSRHAPGSSAEVRRPCPGGVVACCSAGDCATTRGVSEVVDSPRGRRKSYGRDRAGGGKPVGAVAKAATCSTCGAVLSGCAWSEELKFLVYFCPTCRAKDATLRPTETKQAVELGVMDEAA